MPELDPLAAPLAVLRARGSCALIPYVTAGYPTPDSTIPLLLALADAGADIIELGVPFSDPVADGPTIQRSSFAALQQNVTLAWTLDVLREFRSGRGPRRDAASDESGGVSPAAPRDVPVVLFSYLNPILGYGVEAFIRDAASAGAAGVLLTDLPAGADPALERAFQAAPFAFIRLVAPTTPRQRVLRIAADAQGFLYYVASMGVTGARTTLRAQTLDEVARLRELTTVPVAVGFGVSTPAQAAAIARVADGVIVGSAIINALDDGGISGAARLLRDMRAAMDSVAKDDPAEQAPQPVR
ncbi:tryptophan synthase subunit alpha [soil metagenome]